MATYTTQVRSLIESGYDLFDRERPFPIFKEEYRKTLEERITEFYYFREIGLETAGQFKYMLNARLRLIMPYYNKMYETELIEYDPMETYNLTETFTRTGSGISQATGTDKDVSIFSDTPQGKLNGLDYATNLNESDGERSSTSEMENQEEYTRTTTGNTGATSDSRLIMDFRKSFIRIDEMIIKELQDLFMNIY